MQRDLTCWVHLLLQVDFFQSYQSIVAPNESISTNSSRSRGTQDPTPTLEGEAANFIRLQKRYMKGFLTIYNRYNEQLAFIPVTEHGATEAAGKKHSAMFIIDSDFDTEDAEYGDDMEEVISNCVANSVVSEDETQADKLELAHEEDESDDLPE